MPTRSNRPLIYVVDGSIAVTGAFVCARNMARSLVGLVDVVLVLPQGSAIPDTLLGDFRAVHHLPLFNLRKSVVAALKYLPLLLIASWRLCRLMRHDGAETLVLNDFYLMHGACCRMFGFRKRIVAWVRMDPRRFGRAVSYIWLRLLFATSDEVVAVSRYVQSILPKRMPTTLLYDVLAPAPLATVAIATPRLVYVGNYIPGKGQDDAIKAFAAVAPEHPALTLEFYGGDMGVERNRAWCSGLRRRVVELELSGRVHFHEFTAEPATVLAGALAALNFSASESFSMTVLEASGAGLPVIATCSGGPAEIIKDGVTGILVPVGDVAAMSAAIRTLCTDPALAAAMGRAGRARVAKCYSPEVFLEALKSILYLAPKSATKVL